MVCVQLGHLVVTLPALTECAADLVTSGFAEPEAVFAKVFSSTLSWESDLTERNLALQVNAGAPVRSVLAMTAVMNTYKHSSERVTGRNRSHALPSKVAVEIEVRGTTFKLTHSFSFSIVEL